MAKVITLTNGGETIVDDDWHETLSQKNWGKKFLDKFYVIRYGRIKGKQHTTLMHRVIIGAKKGQIVDHINGDTFDNRRSNLRLCSPSGNAQNKNGWKVKKGKYKGVFPHPNNKSWIVKIGCNGIIYYLGCFKSQEEGAIAYNKKAEELHKEFARLNKI